MVSSVFQYVLWNTNACLTNKLSIQIIIGATKQNHNLPNKMALKLNRSFMNCTQDTLMTY